MITRLAAAAASTWGAARGRNMASETWDVVRALSSWSGLGEAPVAPVADGGLINVTWVVGEPPTHVIQRINPIFPDAVHERVRWVTDLLEATGHRTPRLVPTAGGASFHADDGGLRWRVLTFIPGRTFHRVQAPSQAFAAAALVGRFHGALMERVEDLAPLRPSVHDTRRHMEHLARTLEGCGGHRLAEEARQVGHGILRTWERWERRHVPPDLPLRPAHGDLKISNVRFSEDGEALCLLDLDTLGRMTLAEELGDALRSWCNPHGEDRPPQVDPAIFQAALDGYRSAAPFVTRAELAALPVGMARIAVELAARFCADAIHESYFGWNPSLAPTRGEHNLLRARSQLGLGIQALDAMEAGRLPG